MTTRASKLPQSPASTAASHNRVIGAQRRSVTKLLTIDQTAELFGTSSRSVRRFIESGALPVHRLGRSVRISEMDIATFLAANRSV